MSPFQDIHIQGFRRLLDVKLKLKPLNVVIGANGSGKTTLLEVFSLMAASASGYLGEKLSYMSGIDSNLTNLAAQYADKARFMRFELTMPVEEYQPLQYALSLRPQGRGYEIVDESLMQNQGKPQPMKYIQSQHGNVRYFDPGKKKLLKPSWDYNSTETALCQVPKMYKQPSNFRDRLSSSTHYHVLDVSSRAPVRVPQPAQVAYLPGHDGEDLISCLYMMRESDSDRYESVEATLKAAFPQFEELSFPVAAAGTLAMGWKESTSKKPFYMHQLSEGTIRFLWLVTLLHSSALPTVTMIDEPEVSLHPELLAILADLLRAASLRSQIIIATHADRLVRFLKPSEVLTANLGEGGQSEFCWADDLDLEKWLEEYGLDEVWRMGRMGGRS